jgi:hypothetical protein
MIKLGKLKVNKWLLLEILWFASTEEYQADRYLFQACKGSRQLLFKTEQGISLS